MQSRAQTQVCKYTVLLNVYMFFAIFSSRRRYLRQGGFYTCYLIESVMSGLVMEVYKRRPVRELLTVQAWVCDELSEFANS
jgi:hypothetical protein